MNPETCKNVACNEPSMVLSVYCVDCGIDRNSSADELWERHS